MNPRQRPALVSTPPREGAERLAWRQALDAAVAGDVLGAGDDLVEQGAPRDAVPAVLLDLGHYLAARVIRAAEMAASVWDVTR